MIHPDTDAGLNAEFEKLEETEELTGKMSSNPEDQKLMHSVMENDKETIDEGRVINDAINRGIGVFTPDLMFQNITKNYSQAKKLYGETILRMVSGASGDYLEKNVKIPEFQRELKKDIEENIQKLKDKDLLNNDNSISEKAFTLASLVLYTEELDNINAQGIRGEKFSKHLAHHGDKDDIVSHGKSYKDLAIRQTIKTSIRRNHKEVDEKDIKFFKRKSKGQIYVIYGIDSSGSMKGGKIELAKKAGVALAFKATEEKDKVGLIVFGTKVKEKVSPTRDFWQLLKSITKVRTGKETNIAQTIHDAVMMFPDHEVTKHLILLTDAMPNIGKDPEKETLDAAAMARERGVSISMIGIDLDEAGEDLAKKIVEVGEGKLYTAKASDNYDQIILEDYYSL